VQVLARPTLTGFAVGPEQRLELAEQVVVGAEMAEVLVALLLRLGQAPLHLLAVVAVEAVALDDGGADALTPEDVGEGARHRGGAGTGRTSDGNDGMAFRHAAFDALGKVLVQGWFQISAGIAAARLT